MRTSILLLAALSGAFAQKAAVPASAAALGQVRTVYLLSMSGGLDQYLANQLTGYNLMRVVTDPAKADAVITDRIGLPFEARLKELYPPVEPPKPEVKPAAKADAKADDKDDKAKADEKKAKEEPVVRMGSSSWGRGRGNIFLVDVKTKDVIWSTYIPQKNTSPLELDRTARKVALQIKKATGSN